MPSSLSNESKNSYSLTNEDKDNDLTWDEATMTWDEATRTWDSPGRPLTKENKNTSVSLDTDDKI